MSSLENANYAFNEMMVHVPLCTHKEPEKILVIGSADDELKQEVAKHDVDATFGDISVLNAHDVQDIDVIILTDIKVDDLVLANIERILKADGVISMKTSSYHKDKESLISDLKAVGEKYWITMPYSYGHTTSILASKKYHPTADIVLQKSDLLDDLNYYTTEVHSASFVFPAHIHKALTGIAKR